jgi:endonuclease/exonuclease/phosphatase family metal-dependent hydrolase
MKHIILLIVSLSLVWQVFSQNAEKKYKVGCVAFYNLENLFDTIDTPHVRDFEFTPEGPNQWNATRYKKKLADMAFVIKQIGTDVLPIPPAILGVSEIENRMVLEDLVKEPQLAKYNYQVVHYDGPDRRGVDVGLLYMPALFKVTNSQSHRLVHPSDSGFLTRDQLMVSGIYDGEPLHVIVNHWPSRRGGEKASRPLRNLAADLTRHIVDSIQALDANAKIIVMGDLNDDPINESVKKHLNATGNLTKLKADQMYNPYYDLYKKGIGSLAYRDKWNNFDQIIVSPSLTGDDKSKYKLYKARIFNKPFLLNTEGRYKGYPFRTFAGGAYAGGYSDHFPVYILLIKEEN